MSTTSARRIGRPGDGAEYSHYVASGLKGRGLTIGAPHSGIPSMRLATLAFLGFAALVLAGCIVLPVPPLGSQVGQEEIGALKPGHSTRTEVHDALGDPYDSVDRYEIFELGEEQGYLFMLSILPTIGGPMRIGAQDFLALAEYAPDGVLRSLRWEGRVREAGESRFLSFDGERVITRVPTPRPGLAWGDPSAAYYYDRAVAASPDGRKLAITYGTGSGPRGIMLRDGQTGAVLADIVRHPAGCLRRVSPDLSVVTVFLSDNRHLATVAEVRFGCVWDSEQHEGPTPLESSGDRLIDVRAARSAPIVATVNDEGTVEIWDGLSGSRITSVTPCPSDLRCPAGPEVALSDDGRFLATLESELGSPWAWRRSAHGMLRLWDASEGTEIASLDLPEEGPGARGRWLLSIPEQNLAWSPDRQRLALNLGDHVQVWRIGDPELMALPGEVNGDVTRAFELEQVLLLPPMWSWEEREGSPRGSFPSIAFSADGRRLAAGYNSALVWEIGTWRELWRATGDIFDNTFRPGFAFPADGARVITTCCLWRLPDSDEGLPAAATAWSPG